MSFYSSIVLLLLAWLALVLFSVAQPTTGAAIETKYAAWWIVGLFCLVTAYQAWPAKPTCTSEKQVLSTPKPRSVVLVSSKQCHRSKNKVVLIVYESDLTSVLS